jgi:nucleotidyltransferase/DNA polymerase involved in DNA repair
MATKTALKLCPKLVLIPPNFSKYSEASRQVFEIFRQFTDKIEPLSLDEAYLDVSECELFNNSATLIAAEIRKLIFEKTGLTASAGIAPNKLLAKLSSDFKKPHDHFMCSLCGLLRDANLGPIIRPQIEQAIGDGCSIAGNLTVSGICKQCHKEGKDI